LGGSLLSKRIKIKRGKSRALERRPTLQSSEGKLSGGRKREIKAWLVRKDPDGKSREKKKAVAGEEKKGGAGAELEPEREKKGDD